MEQTEQQEQPPLFDNVDITAVEEENDIFESAVQVNIYRQKPECWQFRGIASTKSNVTITAHIAVMENHALISFLP